MTLEKALDSNDLKRALKTDEQAEEIFDMARKLEGIIRNVGKHAAGVVIAPSEINDFSPLYLGWVVVIISKNLCDNIVAIYIMVSFFNWRILWLKN